MFCGLEEEERTRFRKKKKEKKRLANGEIRCLTSQNFTQIGATGQISLCVAQMLLINLNHSVDGKYPFGIRSNPGAKTSLF